MKDLVDISSIGFKVVEKLTMGGIDYFDNKKNEIMDNLFTELFQGLIDEDIISYENEYIKPTREYCYKLLNAALIDEEKEKAIYYSRLYKYILNNQSIVKSKKLNLLKTLKGLSFEAIQLLPNFYVYQNYPTYNFTSLTEYINDLIEDPDQSYNLNILSQFGILKQVQLHGSYTFEHTSLFDEFINILFEKNELTPESLNIKVRVKQILYLADNITGGDVKYIESIISKGSRKKALHRNYKNLINNTHGIELKKFDYVICVFGSSKIHEKSLIKLQSTSKLIKLSIKKDAIDQLPKIGGKMYYIGEDSPNDIDEFIQELQK